MRKSTLKFQLILLVGLALIAFAQAADYTALLSGDLQNKAYWQEQNSGVKETLNAVYFLDEMNGWAAGEKGTIICTEDGGAKWLKQESKTRNAVYGLYFKDKNYGWAVGDGGLLLATADGGKNWQLLKSNTSEPLYSVYFKDEKTGWISGGKLGITGGSASLMQMFAGATRDSSILFATQDGGAGWSGNLTPMKQNLQKMFFLNDQIAWAAGAQGDTLVSLDGGKSWEKKPTKVDKQLFDVYFADPQNGWATGGEYSWKNNGMFGRELVMNTNTVLKTSDGGAKWEPVDIKGESRGIFNCINGFGNIIWITGYAYNKTTAYLTLDNGSSWKKVEIAPFVRDSYFVNPICGWLVGNGGTILHFNIPLSQAPAGSLSMPAAPEAAPTPSATQESK